MQGCSGSRAASLVALALAICIAVPRTAEAVTWALKSVKRSSLNDLPNFFGDPYDPENFGCDAAGTCQPYTTTVNVSTLWYWCGWKTQLKSNYVITVNKGSNITALLMKKRSLDQCVLGNPAEGVAPQWGLSGIKNCEQVFSSVCDTQAYCEKSTFPLAFPDEACLLIANNKNTSTANITFQFYQYHDSPRYYGTVFSVFLTILFLGGWCYYFINTCLKEWKAPSDRVHELRALEQRLLGAGQFGAKELESGSDVTEVNPVKGRVVIGCSAASTWLHDSLAQAKAKAAAKFSKGHASQV